MTDLVRLFTQIALLRRGPQDVPAYPLLLALTVAAYFLINVALSTVLPPLSGPWLAHLTVEIVFTFVWYALLLNLVRRPERFVQTATAVYGFHALLSPLVVTVMWLTRRFDQESVWHSAAALLSLAVLIWMITANSYIVKAALEWSMPQSVALVILQTLSGDLLALSLFPIPNV
jgi:hypothetical protein